MEQVVQKPMQPVISQQPMVKKVNFSSNFSNKTNMILALGAVAVVLVGVGVGWKLSGTSFSSSTGNTTNTSTTGKKITAANEAGVADEGTFKDTAEGMLEAGGIDGEGTYHLVRSADASKNVYLSSTVIDLASFEGKKVQVWGQTLSGKKAGWLMDVGKIKVIE